MRGGKIRGPSGRAPKRAYLLDGTSGLVRTGGPPPAREHREVVGVGRHADRASATRRASTPLNANAKAVLALLRVDDWQPGGLLATDAGLNSHQGAAALRELRRVGLAEGRTMGKGRFGQQEWRRLEVPA